MSTPLRISPRFRLALAAKAVLLLSLAAVFFVIAVQWWGRSNLLVRVSGSALMAIGGGSLVWAALLGLADALVGDATQMDGAVPLKSRRSGYSLQLPDGKFVEYVLYNPWPTLEQGKTYTVVYGKFSRVLVERPIEQERGRPA